MRRGDGQMVQLGPLQYALLECLDGRRDAGALATAMCERLGRTVEPEHVEALARKLAAQGLIAGSEQNAPPRPNPLLALRWKYLITDRGVTERLTRPFTGLFRPWVVVPVLAAFLAVAWFVLVHKGVASATAEAFERPELLLLVFVLGIASAGFHELGHAAACRYGGARPGGMGVGLYMVWPAFYTDVTDSYRLPRRSRLRVDLGGLYFNALVAVVTVAAWLALRVDALLLIVALQLIQMVKQLSPVIRADGYHILSDVTGVPDLYAHIGPTLRRLIPGRRREDSALTGRARFVVSAWVLIVVPLLLALSVSLILLMPRLVATAWESGRQLAGGVPEAAGDGRVADVAIAVLRLVALTLPVLGVIAMTQMGLRSVVRKARAWSADRPGRRAALTLASVGVLLLLAWAWWPSGQYRPVRADDRGTLIGAREILTSPASAVRPARPATQLQPGKHLAVALIPEGGATKERPAAFVIKGDDDQEPVVVLSPTAPDPSAAATAPPQQASPTSAPATAEAAAPEPSRTSTSASPIEATAFPFKLPAKPGPNGTQALAVNTKDGAVEYVVAYTIVTVHDGADVDHTNEAYAFASCTACTTVAVSFQVVLVVGHSDLIAPINVAGALNANCPECITTAIANQIVVTLDEEPTPELLERLNAELRKLEELSSLGGDATPSEIAAEVEEIERQIHQELESVSTGTTTTSPSTSTTGTQSSTTTTTTTTPQDSSTAPGETTTETTPTQTQTDTTQTDTQTTTEPSSTETTTTPAQTETTTTTTSP